MDAAGVQTKALGKCGAIMGKRSRMMVLCGAVIALPLLGGGVARALGEPAASSRASRPIAATTTPTTTSVNWHFEGNQSGLEHFQLSTPRCPVLDHALQGTFTLTDGTVWRFREKYCGTVDAHSVWRGVGSFSLTATDGSKLGGTFTSSAQLPSVGVPYQLDIKRGTGQFAGASGSCVLENHVHVVAFGTQDQHGVFVCDLNH